MEEPHNDTVVSPVSADEPQAVKTELWPSIGWPAHLGVIAVLGAALLLSFANTLHNTGFALDNKFIILEDPRLRDNKHENIKQIFTQDYWWPKAVSGLYRPLTTFSYMFNYKILGNRDDSTGYHWVNFLLHWANAVLVYFVALLLFEKVWPALFTALLYGVHPIVTESVTNIVGRADLLATFSVLLGTLCYARSGVANVEQRPPKLLLTIAVAATVLLTGLVFLHRTQGELFPAALQSSWWVVLLILGLVFSCLSICLLTGGWRKVFWLFLLLLSTMVGMFCKESAVVVLGVIGLYDLTYRLDKKHPNWFRNLFANFWGFLWRGYIALLPAFVTLWYVRSWVFAQLRPPELPFVDNPLISADFWMARLTAIKVIGKYFALLIWPQPLSCDYSYNQIPVVTGQFGDWEDIQAYLALVVVLVVLGVALWNFRRNRAVFFFILFFFGTLLPSSNLMPNPTFGQSIFDKTSWCIGSIMAERFLYLPLLGFTGCFVVATYAIVRRIVPQLDISAWSKRIWLQVVARSVLCLVALWYGMWTFSRNFDWEDDVRLWSQAVQAAPNSFKTHKSLAYALYERDPEYKDIDRIIEEAEKAVQITDKTQIVFLHLGAYYRIKGDLLAQRTADGALISSAASIPWYQKSTQTLARAVPLDRDFNDDNRRKELRRGRKREEIPDIGNHEIYWNLGLSYMRLGNHAEALKAYEYMRHLAPANADAYLSIASVYIVSGRNEDAAVTLLQALLLDPNRQQALNLLVEIYRQIDRDGNAVITAPSRPPQLNADSPLVRTHLCRSHAGLARIFTEAKQPNLAEQFRKAALDNYKCAADLLTAPAIQ